jgi:hypothetical protein
MCNLSMRLTAPILLLLPHLAAAQKPRQVRATSLQSLCLPQRSDQLPTGSPNLQQEGLILPWAAVVGLSGSINGMALQGSSSSNRSHIGSSSNAIVKSTSVGVWKRRLKHPSTESCCLVHQLEATQVPGVLLLLLLLLTAAAAAV